jgi:hypothetical protein
MAVGDRAIVDIDDLFRETQLALTGHRDRGEGVVAAVREQAIEQPRSLARCRPRRLGLTGCRDDAATRIARRRSMRPPGPVYPIPPVF